MISFSSHSIRPFLAGTLLFVLSGGLTAQELRIPAKSLVVNHPGSALVESSEAFEVPDQVLGALRQSRTPVVVSDFPVAPGQREPVRWERTEVWTDGAKLHVQTADGVEQWEPPRGRFFRGTGMMSGAALAVTLTDGRLSGLSSLDGVVHHIVPRAAGDRTLHAIERHEVREGVLDRTCANADRVINESVFREARSASAGTVEAPLASPKGVHSGSEGSVDPVSASLRSARGGVDKQAVIAIDTDTSFMAAKGPSISDVNDYIAALFLAMNVFYERDLGVRLLVGDTFYNSVSDPYTNGVSPADGNLLYEFRNYWNNAANGRSNVDRVFTMLLSGESSSANSASGIAFVGGSTYCGSQGYSVNQIFRASWVSIESDASLVGHEIGHNAGSPHTHCYNSPIDQCSNFGNGCYAGATSCPGGAGTMMSYCHLNGCGANRLEFHPTVINALSAAIDANYPTCVEPLRGADEIFFSGFENGNTNAWQ